MSQASAYRYLLFGLIGLLLVVSLFFGHQLWRGYNEYRVARENLESQREALAKAKERYEINEDFLNKLLSDQAFFERVVRERLGYSKPNEFVFRFPETGEEP